MTGKNSGRLRTLKKKRDFTRVYARGKHKAGRLLVLYGLPSGRPGVRFGFVVGRRIGSAVVRNRVRRILREVCRRHMERFRDGYDFVVVARERARDAGFAGLEREMLRVAGSIGVVRDA
ncbi:MAG: ribonuclease P protein component [Bacillota bacterium]